MLKCKGPDSMRFTGTKRGFNSITDNKIKHKKGLGVKKAYFFFGEDNTRYKRMEQSWSINLIELKGEIIEFWVHPV